MYHSGQKVWATTRSTRTRFAGICILVAIRSGNGNFGRLKTRKTYTLLVSGLECFCGKNQIFSRRLTILKNKWELLLNIPRTQLKNIRKNWQKRSKRAVKTKIESILIFFFVPKNGGYSHTRAYLINISPKRTLQNRITSQTTCKRNGFKTDLKPVHITDNYYRYR